MESDAVTVSPQARTLLGGFGARFSARSFARTALPGFDYMDAFRERDPDGDRSNAIKLLYKSMAISSELDIRPVMEWVLSR